MPKAMHPNQKYKVVLKCDEDIESPPTFIFRYITGAQHLEAVDLYENINDKNSQHENILKTFDLAQKHLIGWENMIDPNTGQAIPFDPDKLAEICTVLEAMELCQKVLFGQVLDSTDKKKLESPSDCDSEESANPAEE